MITPKFLKKNGTIGIVAPSDGFEDKKFKEASLRGAKKLEDLGFKVKYSNSCFKSKNGRSASARIRAKEFKEMYFNDDIDILLAISGGEYEMEILKYLPWKKMKENPKLFAGYSDNSLISFLLLTNLEMVNIYGHNLYELAHDHEVIDSYIEALQGNFLTQTEIKDVSREDYDYSEDTITREYKIDYKNDWKIYNAASISLKGIVIGGLMDNLNCICGTKYDKVKKFIKKYKDDGFIWYFDICLMSPEEVKRALFQFKNAGWFKYAKAIMIGRPIIQSDSFGISYQDNMIDELKDLNIPVLLDVNISHIHPSFHMINGKKAKLSYINGIGKIEYLKEEK